MRLIDADALYEHIESYAGMFNDELGFVVNLRAVLDGIAYQPTIETYTEQDVRDAYNDGYSAGMTQSARHGRWELMEDMCGDYVRCSECGDEFVCWEADCALTNYCPNCGAKMDGDLDD